MRIALTSLAIERIGFTGRQAKYWDTQLKGFGILVGATTKTFFVMKGKERKFVALGRFPDLALREARLKAMAEMTQESDPPQKTLPGAILGFLEGKEGRVAPHTYYSYKHYLESFELKGGLEDLSQEDILDELDKFEDKPAAQNYAFTVMKGFLNWCVDRDYIQKNPLRGIDSPTQLSSRDRVLTDEELASIWRHTNFAPYGFIVRLLMLTGQRRMEIKTLTPQQLTEETIAITKTKNKKPHLIPLTPLMKEHIRLPFTFNDWSRAKDRLDKKCGVQDWVHHDLRRTMSTNLARMGVPLHITELLLNHRSSAISGVAAVYNRHQFIPEMREALLLWEGHVRRITTPRH